MDLTNSLLHFLSFLEKHEQGLTLEILKALKYSWGLAKDSLRPYIGVDGDNALLKEVPYLEDEVDSLPNLYNEIDECFKKLK